MGRPSPRPLLLLRPTLRLMLMPTTEAMVDTVSDTTERERPRLRLVMARGGVMATEDMDTEPEATTMARGRPMPSLVTTRTGATATGPEATMVMAMVTVSTTDKRSDENCQSSIEFRC